jgi:hypothetical protein
MTEYKLLRRKIIIDHLERFPNTPSTTLARIIARDNPLLFKDIEDARGMIRVYRGQSGKLMRDNMKRKEYYTYEENQSA